MTGHSNLGLPVAGSPMDPVAATRSLDSVGSSRRPSQDLNWPVISWRRLVHFDRLGRLPRAIALQRLLGVALVIEELHLAGVEVPCLRSSSSRPRIPIVLVTLSRGLIPYPVRAGAASLPPAFWREANVEGKEPTRFPPGS